MADVKSFFRCKECGACCQGQTTVSLDENDLERLRKFMRLSDAVLFERYLRVTGTVVQMKIADGHCIFYNKGCTIHPAKPWRCQQWPLHPSILADELNFAAIKKSCPGINAGLSYSEFCRLFADYLKETGQAHQ